MELYFSYVNYLSSSSLNVDIFILISLKQCIACLGINFVINDKTLIA